MVEVPVLNTGIAWTSDKDIKFRNPLGDLKTGEMLTLICIYLYNNMPTYNITKKIVYEIIVLKKSYNSM